MTFPQLPSPYPHHKHSSAEAREIAQNGLILLTEVGSTVHGTNLTDADDYDEMGICIEPVDYVLGLSRVPASALHPDDVNARTGMIAFEQYERHTAWDRPGGLRERSGPGDTDCLVYGARKWARLALDGNPTVLLPLFSPNPVYMTDEAEQLRFNAHRFASKQSVRRFLGYLVAQRESMTGERSKRTNRPELVEIHGYDTKFAAHAVRLGLQGIEFATQREITLPIPEPDLSMVRSIRQGEVHLDTVLDIIEQLKQSLEHILTLPILPDQGDQAWLNWWLASTYQKHWNDTTAKTAGKRWLVTDEGARSALLGPQHRQAARIHPDWTDEELAAVSGSPFPVEDIR